jgi:hypothetical protein
MHDRIAGGRDEGGGVVCVRVCLCRDRQVQGGSGRRATAYAHGCKCTYGRCMPSAVTFSGCLTGKYSAEAGSVNCTACEAGEDGQRAAVVNSIVRLHAVLSCGRKRDSSAGVRHTKVMASCMRSEAERPRLALTMLTVAGRQLLGCQRCFLLP